MQIEMISSETIKVSLTKQDMDDYELTFESLDRSNIQTKELFIDIIEQIKLDMEMDFTDEKLFIEAIPRVDGGCLLYITALEPEEELAAKQKSVSLSIVCEIENYNHLINLCSVIYAKHLHKVHKSELYYDQGSYRLILHTLKKQDIKLVTLVNEYAEVVGEGELFCSMTREHYDCIVNNRAVESVYNTIQ